MGEYEYTTTHGRQVPLVDALNDRAASALASGAFCFFSLHTLLLRPDAVALLGLSSIVNEAHGAKAAASQSR